MDPIQPPIQEPTPQPIQPVQKHNLNYWKMIARSALTILALTYIVFMYLQNQKLQKQVLNPPVSPTIQVPTPTPKTVSSISIPPDETAGWKNYESTGYGFSFKYPAGYQLETTSEGPMIALWNKKPSIESRNLDNNLSNSYYISFAENDRNQVKDLTESGIIPKNRLKPINIGSYQAWEDIKPVVPGGVSEKVLLLDNPLKKTSIEIRYWINLDVSNTEYQLFEKSVHQILSTFKFLGGSSTSELLNIKSSGGLCPNGNVCSSTKIIMNDGSILIDNKLKTKADLTKLISLINTANFDEIRSKKFTGTCPTAYDGQEVTYTFYTLTVTQTISNCEFEIDNKSPLFSEINKILSNLPN